jgi:hypothetical protein
VAAARRAYGARRTRGVVRLSRRIRPADINRPSSARWRSGGRSSTRATAHLVMEGDLVDLGTAEGQPRQPAPMGPQSGVRDRDRRSGAASSFPTIFELADGGPPTYRRPPARLLPAFYSKTTECSLRRFRDFTRLLLGRVGSLFVLRALHQIIHLLSGLVCTRRREGRSLTARRSAGFLRR